MTWNMCSFDSPHHGNQVLFMGELNLSGQHDTYTITCVPVQHPVVQLFEKPVFMKFQKYHIIWKKTEEASVATTKGIN